MPKAHFGSAVDCIDIHIEVLRVDYEKLSGERVGKSSDTIRARIQAARNIQHHHFSNNTLSDIVRKAGLRVGGIRQFRQGDRGKYLYVLKT